MSTAPDLPSDRGLSSEEAAARLSRDGFNELPTARRRGIGAIAADVLREPMILLLLGAGAIYLLLGDVREALVLLFSVFVVVAISLYQNHKTERALERLRDLSSPRALVIRDGARVRIPGREVVRGDLLLLAEGDRVAADATLQEGVNVSADESLLTGESVPVRKRAQEAVPPSRRPGGEDLPFVFSGTLIVGGQGLARVDATGAETELGKIGVSLREVRTGQTPLQRETNRVVRRLAGIGLTLCLAVVVLYGLLRGGWLDGLLAGIALAMALMPEELPVVLTIFLAIGAWRISRENVLTRRLPAIETLGAATVFCVDKTGTLTWNRMAVSRLVAGSEIWSREGADESSLPEAFHEVVEYGILASHREPFDPMEQAIREVGTRTLAGTEHVHGDWELVKEYPLSPALLAMSRVWKSESRREYVVAAKGAPEAIADLCHLSEAEARELARATRSLADDGLRVLGVAKAAFPSDSLPPGQHDFAFRIVGLIGLSDPVRETVPAAIAECREAGIRIIMITGDYPETARSIAGRIGLVGGETVGGAELEAMDAETLRRRVRSANVFARVVPEQKLRLVRALKAEGEIVAMTGDGVNDAPALKAADIGIAMGGRGTDVARETADLVLLDDDFGSIVKAVRLGRRIFDNLRKTAAYIIAIHVPIAGLALVPILLGWPLVLLPVHIVFLELIIDPACSLVFEAEPAEGDVMKRPPRDPKATLFDRRTVWLSLLQGASVLLIVLAVFGVAFLRGQGEDDARALSFTTLIVANLGLILANRSWSETVLPSLRRPNRALVWVLGGSAALLTLILAVPVLRDLFRFSRLQAVDVAICLAAGLLSITWFEIFKLWTRNARKRGETSGGLAGSRARHEDDGAA